VTLCPVYATLHKACFFKAVVMMPHRKGSVNYKKKLLIDIVLGILPSGVLVWEAVACTLHEHSKEEIVRDLSDLKNGSRHCAMG
jgi:hypothetical protein